MAPAVIYIDEIEKIYAKKKSKNEEDPSRIKKALEKVWFPVLTLHWWYASTGDGCITPGGLRSCHWMYFISREQCCWYIGWKIPEACIFPSSKLCNAIGTCCRLLARIDLLQNIWQRLLTRRLEGTGQSLPLDFDYRTLAYISQDFTGGGIWNAIKAVLPKTRIERVICYIIWMYWWTQLPKKPLEPGEFINALSKQVPVYPQKFEAIRVR